MGYSLITAGQGLKRIMAKEIAPVYSLIGNDIFFQDTIINGITNKFLSEEGEKNTIVLGNDSEEQLLTGLNSTSLFSQKAIFVVRNSMKIKSKYSLDILDYCKSPNLDKIVIFIYDDFYLKNKLKDQISKYSIDIDMRTPFPNKIKEWVNYYLKKNKINLSNHILDQLINEYGENINNVINEIDKLYLYSNSKTEELDSKLNINIYKKENQVWKLLDSVGKRDKAKSLDIYSELYNNNTPLIKVLLNLLDLFKEILNKKMNIDSGKIIRNKIILKNLYIYENKFSIDQILFAIKLLRNCDVVSKTTSINEKYLVNAILVEICEGVYV